MFIYVTYKDVPELSTRRSSLELVDTSVEKSLLVNPDCPVRIMLEYIRKKCRLGTFTQFDLCDETGQLMGLFSLNTYAYATKQFEHKKNYYLIVIKAEKDKPLTIFPQLNQENKLYLELQQKVVTFLTVGESSNGNFPSRKSPVSLQSKKFLSATLTKEDGVKAGKKKKDKKSNSALTN